MAGFLVYILPTRSQSFMLDLVVCAMPALLVSLLISIRLAKQDRVRTHQRLQWVLSIVLGVVIVAFEVDMRLNGWSAGVTPSGNIPAAVHATLAIHIACAIGTLFFWGMALWSGKQTIADKTPKTIHVRNGRAAAYGLVATTITGWLFYALAFIVEWESAQVPPISQS